MESRRFRGLLPKMLSCYLVSASHEESWWRNRTLRATKMYIYGIRIDSSGCGMGRRLLKQKRPAEWKPGRPLRGKANCLEPELSAKFRGERMRNGDAARRN